MANMIERLGIAFFSLLVLGAGVLLTTLGVMTIVDLIRGRLP